ncbi:hypothetical protein E2605_07610 [Dysgonomonas capnocytophagoides]|uniref:Uncharacterized protein n=1 Tax=Dysgonomonas capnocytophagoides TaxID=45254 RepID=A0A4Y8L317_9BACT|nr:hypothetical protein [Dysgonomonas capnocytophagoides]TFD96677.1 hypothetical protein E2605_07610 [Dysgonomonas capnocytophagoides]
MVTRQEYNKALDIVEQYHKQIGLEISTVNNSTGWKDLFHMLDPEKELGFIAMERVVGTSRILITQIISEEVLIYQNAERDECKNNPRRHNRYKL